MDSWQTLSREDGYVPATVAFRTGSVAFVVFAVEMLYKCSFHLETNFCLKPFIVKGLKVYILIKYIVLYLYYYLKNYLVSLLYTTYHITEKGLTITG